MAASWNELTWTFPHTSGSKAVLSIRVDIHLIGGGVIQDQRRTRVLARSIIPKLAACLALNNSTIKKLQGFYISCLKTLLWAQLLPLSSNGNSEQLQGWSFVLWRWKGASGTLGQFSLIFERKEWTWGFLVLNKKPWHSGGELLGFTWEQEWICMPQTEEFSLQAVTRSRQTVLSWPATF